MRASTLVTPPLPCIAPPGTFDAFGWCASDALEWRCPREAPTHNALDDALPLGMAFVFRAPFDALPAERAWLHIGRAHAAAIGITEDANCLAPWALDDATDTLFAHRRPPGAVFWLAADNVNALYWALHDWSHFHNHGSFDDRPSTEYQCDVAALAWLWLNRDAVSIRRPYWDALRASALENHLRLRDERPGSACPAPALLEDGEALRALAEALRVGG